MNKYLYGFQRLLVKDKSIKLSFGYAKNETVL